MAFKNGIKREDAVYPTLKGESYFDSLSRSLFIVAKSYEYSDVFDPTYTTGSVPEQKELFEAQQTFMFSVFNVNLLTDMGRTIARKHLATTDTQEV